MAASLMDSFVLRLLLCVVVQAISVDAGSVATEADVTTSGDATNVKITDEDVATAWLDKFNEGLEKHLYKATVAKWNYETNLTSENERIMGELQFAANNFTYEYLAQLVHFDWKKFQDPALRRRFWMYARRNERKIEIPTSIRQRFGVIFNSMKRIYSTGKVCRKTSNTTQECLTAKPGLDRLFATNRDWDTLLWAWKAWRDETGKPMRELYNNFVEVVLNCTVKKGHKDMGAIWRSYYELMDFEAEIHRLWEEVKPLYMQLHTFVRKRLQNIYKDHPFPTSGHIPAHIVGNLWGQMWNEVADITLPYPNAPAMDVTADLRAKGYNVSTMYRLADNFFQSLGLEPMPPVFWQKSMLTRPKDGRHVVCHPSAWDLHNRKDFRIKACTDISHADLKMVHHEMGHVQYFLQYRHLPFEFRKGANPGFHEAVGDVISLSVATPEHLHSIGLTDEVHNDTEADLNFLMLQALQKVAFLPYGFLIDQWRWKVFRQDVPPEEFTASWWKLRCKYQGLYPPVPRSSEDFDPGSKYHISANVPYIRYFVSFILQFQFHKTLCEKAGNTGPLHRCDIYNSKEAGQAFRDMLSLGCSKPWPEVLKQMTGSERIDARALLDYFRPLHEWLVEQNKGERIGFDEECPPGSILSKGSRTAESLLEILPDRNVKEEDMVDA